MTGFSKKLLRWLGIIVAGLVGVLVVFLVVAQFFHMHERAAREESLKNYSHTFDIERCYLGVSCERVGRSLNLDGYPTLAECREEARKAIERAEATLATSLATSYRAECEYNGPTHINGIRVRRGF